jgi:hypothetical protein
MSCGIETSRAKRGIKLQVSKACNKHRKRCEHLHPNSMGRNVLGKKEFASRLQREKWEKKIASAERNSPSFSFQIQFPHFCPV